MRYTTIFFDLDNTLYHNSTGVWKLIRDRMNLYMVEKLNMPWEQVLVLRRQYYLEYGTTLRGLQKHHQVDENDYLAYVHDLPLERYLEPAPELRAMILSLPQTRWIFTNADDEHAARVLDKLELAGCFAGIIDIRAIDFACKPEPEAYKRALEFAGNPSPEECVFLDDSTSNLAPAHEMGFTTVLVQDDRCAHPAADLSIAHLLELRQVLPILWNGLPIIGGSENF